VKKIKQLVVTFSGTGIGPRQRGGNPRTIHIGGSYLLSAG
jgi:hypothetical protein